MLLKLALALPLIAFPWRAAPSTAASATDDLTLKLKNRVSNYNPGVFNFIGALIRVSNDFQIPMGIVWVNTAATHTEMPFAWRDATVGEIIEAIATTQPGYKVQIGNGVAHVFPSGLIPDAQNFLNKKIDTFETRNAMVEVASFKLHMLVTPIKGNHQISIAGPGDSQVSLELKNCAVEDVLDALAVASNRKIWIVAFPDNPTLTANGLRRTRSVFTDAPIQDDQQPVWYLHRWGDPLPPLVSGAPPPQVR